MAQLHDAMKPLGWLVGKWRTTKGIGQYPTMKEFNYIEEIEFFQVGQPNLQFALYSFNATTKAPMHREIGFLRIKPGTNVVAFFSAHNMGLSGMEEGLVNGEELTLKSTNIGRMSFGTSPAVKQLKRCLRKNGDQLEQVIEMETEKTSLTEHLRAVYDRVE